MRNYLVGEEMQLNIEVRDRDGLLTSPGQLVVTAAPEDGIPTGYTLGTDDQLARLSTTVTTGASSATQAIGDTSSMAVGDTLTFGAGNRTIANITDLRTVVLTASVVSTTGETINVVGRYVLVITADVAGSYNFRSVTSAPISVARAKMGVDA